jgi:hypothetical protein
MMAVSLQRCPMISRVSVLVLAHSLAGMTIARAEPVNPVAHLNAIDANGRIIGPVLTVTSEAQVMVPMSINGRTFVLGVEKEVFRSIGAEAIYFDSADCTGNAFSLSSGEGGRSILRQAVVGVPNMTVYEVQEAQQPALLRSVSFVSDLPYRCQNLGPFEFEVPYARLALPLVDLTTRFTPPFSVR